TYTQGRRPLGWDLVLTSTGLSVGGGVFATGGGADEPSAPAATVTDFFTPGLPGVSTITSAVPGATATGSPHAERWTSSPPTRIVVEGPACCICTSTRPMLASSDFF